MLLQDTCADEAAKAGAGDRDARGVGHESHAPFYG
ncbi:hypothetical protein GZL_08464 [Streptomyces sp. 769]|nr:hypothetical protein GZL_08464 [Streptomyces sp. 769]